MLQVGVKAPGNEKTTTFLLPKISSVVTSCQRNGLSPPMLASRTRYLKVIWGTVIPGLMFLVPFVGTYIEWFRKLKATDMSLCSIYYYLYNRYKYVFQ